MTTLSLSRKTLLSLIAASAVSMTSLAFAQTAAMAPDAAPPPPAAAVPAPHDGPMQESAAAPAPNTASAPMAATDKPKSWKELDANKDGYLSKSEFKKHEADLKKLARNDKK